MLFLTLQVCEGQRTF